MVTDVMDFTDDDETLTRYLSHWENSDEELMNAALMDHTLVSQDSGHQNWDQTAMPRVEEVDSLNSSFTSFDSSNSMEEVEQTSCWNPYQGSEEYYSYPHSYDQQQLISSPVLPSMSHMWWQPTIHTHTQTSNTTSFPSTDTFAAVDVPHETFVKQEPEDHGYHAALHTNQEFEACRRIETNRDYETADPFSQTKRRKRPATADPMSETSVKRRAARVARDVKFFPCLYGDCGNVYLRSSHLKVHVRKHTGEKPFKCSWPDCDWRFRRSDELSRHKRCHSGVKPYHCGMCGKSFARSDHLAKHVKVHERSRSQQTSSGFNAQASMSESPSSPNHEQEFLF